MSTTKYITTAAGIAVGMAAGNAVAAPVLTSTAPSGYTGTTFYGTTSGLLGSFDISGANLDVINVNGNFSSDVPKVSFSSANAGAVIAGAIRTVAPTGNTDQFATAYATLPDTFSTGSSSGFANVTKSGTSNFSSTPLFGETQFVNASGGTSNGYFKGTADGNTFTLLDYGLVGAEAATAAVPEPGEWAMLATGIGGIGAVLRRRRKSAGAGMTAAIA